MSPPVDAERADGPSGDIDKPLTASPDDALAGLVLRKATVDDLPACAALWRDSINDYLGRLNLPLIPNELAAIGRLHAHLQSTDPDRFLVVTRRLDTKRAETSQREQVVAFGSAIRRGRLWFLSMLFVSVEEQGRGVGRGLLAHLLPEPAEGAILATATDSLQPISNALYSAYGIVPRMPLLNLVGRPREPDLLGALPDGVRAEALDGVGQSTEARDAIDAEVLGFSHPQDHAFLRAERREGFLYRGAVGEVLGYGYTSAVGRVGPVAVRDEALLWPVLGHLLTVVKPRGASALWAPGQAANVIAGLLSAGFRLDDYPILVCWSEPFADFRRYLPISPGLL